MDIALETKEPWASLLVDGLKSVETREYKLPDYLKGREVLIGVAESKPHYAAGEMVTLRVIGVVKFEQCRPYLTRRMWNSESMQHCVSTRAPASEFGWSDDGPRKYAWDVVLARRYETPKYIRAERIMRSILVSEPMKSTL